MCDDRPALGQPAVEKGEQGPLDLGPPESVTRDEPVVVDLLEGLDVLLGQAVKRGAPDVAEPVQTRKAGNGLGHAGEVGREPGPRADPGTPGGGAPEPRKACPQALPGCPQLDGTEAKSDRLPEELCGFLERVAVRKGRRAAGTFSKCGVL